MSSPSNSNRWSVRTEDGIAGPFTIDQLRSMVRQGSLDRHTPIRAEGASNWIRAGQYPAIFTVVSSEDRSAASQQGTKSDATAPPPIRRTPARVSVPPSNTPFILAGCVALAIVCGLVFLMFRPSSTPNQASQKDQEKGQSATLATDTNSKASSNIVSDLKDGGNKNRDTTSSSAKTQYNTEELVAMTEHAVVTVLAGEGHGSGFVVASNLVATNYHVIADDDGDGIKCFFPSAAAEKRGPFAARLVAEDPNADLAIVRIECDVKPLELANNTNFRRGQDVIAIGTPALFNGQDILPNAVTRGVVSSQHDLFGEARYQLAMAVNSGNSGGPVIGLDGLVVGVVVSKSRSEEAIGFCVPASSLRKLMDSRKFNNFAVTEEVRSQHQARLTARELVTLTLDLEKFLVQFAKIVEDKSGASAQQLSANKFAEVFNGLITEINPEIRKDFSLQLSAIADDDNLSPRLRTELRALLDRHLALHKAIAMPSGSVQTMIEAIANLRNRFLGQLRKVDKLLPLGFPELIE